MVIASMAAWFTPAVLFCVLNLVIATIFIASNFKSPHNHGNSPGQLTRSPSLLQRVQSMNLSSFCATPESETTGYNSMSQLNRAPSLLERVKSIDFSFSSFYATPHDYQAHPESEQTRVDSPGQLARAPSLLERVKSINFSSFYAQSENPVHTESEQLNDSPSQSTGVTDHDSGDAFGPNTVHVTSGKSENPGVAPATTSSGKMMKSRSEKRPAASDDVEEDVDRRRPATARVSVRATDESVDAKADDFINRFKQQLKLQRLDSLARLKEMMHRGT